MLKSGDALASISTLAGADYDKRDLETETTVQERKESIAINKSLLALKECFRSETSLFGPGELSLTSICGAP